MGGKGGAGVGGEEFGCGGLEREVGYYDVATF